MYCKKKKKHTKGQTKKNKQKTTNKTNEVTELVPSTENAEVSMTFLNRNGKATVAFETLGVVGSESLQFLKDLGRRIHRATEGRWKSRTRQETNANAETNANSETNAKRESKWLLLLCWSALSLSRPSTSPTSTASPTSNTVVIFEGHSMLLCNS